MASGWRFPSDWALPEVDLVCAAVLLRTDLYGALSRLGRARAHAGAGLDETLTDLAALHAVASAPEEAEGLVSADPDAAPTRLVRATALAWADASAGKLHCAQAAEALTGLATEAYLRTRLGELYRQAARGNRRLCETHVLLAVTLDLSEVVGESRLVAMVLVADVLRDVFDGGESVAVLGPSVAVVLAERDAEFGRRALSAGWLITERLSSDPHLHPARRPWLRLEHLPATMDSASHLLHHLARA